MTDLYEKTENVILGQEYGNSWQKSEKKRRQSIELRR